MICFTTVSLLGQNGRVAVHVLAEGLALPFANVELRSPSVGTFRMASTDSLGNAYFEALENATYLIEASFTGMASDQATLVLTAGQTDQNVSLILAPDPLLMQQVVVTGTRTFQHRSDAPVMVGVIDVSTLEHTQSCCVSEGLKYQAGLRVETDCQTCNYTQLRMNGLGGGYSQILINGRPIFSALTGLYGLEQLPSHLVERIEVVRGGGSALYGSSAIGGTVNVITRTPKKTYLELSSTVQVVGEQALENITQLGGGLVNKTGTSGLTLMGSLRERQAYDQNGDQFSELPALSGSAFGLGYFRKPTAYSKLEASAAYLGEHRYGGDLKTRTPHLAEQSEDRQQGTWMSSLDYQLNSRNGKRSLIAYAGAQHTDRDHFTGVQPDDAVELASYVAHGPYGSSLSTTLQGGLQVNQDISSTPLAHVVTVGIEHLVDDVLDQIESYNYLIDQRTQNTAAYAQSNWHFARRWTALTGVRADKHNLMNGVVWSPRAALMYKPSEGTQFRASVGRGFRAPQAFDADTHIAFAGGGVSRISLADDLEAERSTSFSLSYNADWMGADQIAGLTLEAFYTRLDNAFVLEEMGQDGFGLRFEKANGKGAVVQGISAEFRANLRRKMQLQSGFTVQTSTFDEAVHTLDNLPGRTNFLRTPDHYGFANVLLMPNQRFTGTIGLVYTGSMELAHFAGAPEQLEDAYSLTDAFWEWNLRAAYTLRISSPAGADFEVFAGVKNVTGAYQTDFDSGKNRDSNYVYGPSLPRTFFVGLKWGVL